MSQKKTSPKTTPEEPSGETLHAGEAIRVTRRGEVAVLWIDVPGASVNTLRADFAPQMHRALDAIEGDAATEGDDAIEALVITSAKPAGFLAGADIGMLRRVDGPDAARKLSRQAQQVMDRVADFRVPVVAAIHGPCLGGGLELALACHGRVASNADETRLGLPEVKLGLIPGGGGTQRLPRLIGLEDALTLILTGRRLTAEQARDQGLVDELVHPAILVDVAVEHARRRAHGDAPDRDQREALGERLRDAMTGGNPLGRRVVYRQARDRAEQRAHGNLPAPGRAIDVIRAGLEDGMDAGLRREAEAFGELACTPQARNLMRLFEARQALGRESGVPEDVEPRPVRRVGVLGAGLMGGGIAYVSAAEAGVRVRIRDLERAPVREALRDVRGHLDDRVRKGLGDARERDRVMGRLSGTTGYEGFGGCDLVIEAVAEKLDVKRQVRDDIEVITGDDTIFASNTSAIPIAQIAEGAARPQNVLGMHYFSPVHKVPLIEVVRAPETAPEAVATAVAFGKRQGLTPIVVHDGPGFYTSRVLGRYLLEAGRLLEEGVAIDAIDRALVDAGFPVGPFQLMDEVGLDVALGVARTLAEAFGDRMPLPDVITRAVDDERHGRKNGRGFYRYADGERVDHAVDETIYRVVGVKDPGGADPERIVDRCLTAFANEAAWCHGDGIVRAARDADVGAVFGLGFPPHRGGPLAMIDAIGCSTFVSRLWALRRDHGARFEPAPVLIEAVERGVGLHDDGAPAPGWHRQVEAGQGS